MASLRALTLPVALLVSVSVAAAASCGVQTGGSPAGSGGHGAGTSSASASASSSGSGGAGAGGADAGPMSFSDFPAAPVVDPSAPAGAPGLFAGMPGGSGAGPCLSEPPLGAMYPLDWTPPLFEWSAPAGMNAFELRLHVPDQTNDLVVYTGATSYTLPAAIWAALTSHSGGQPISLTLRGAQVANGQLQAGPAIGAQGDLQLAPVPAGGSVVYWTPYNGSALKGFLIGNIAPTTLVVPSQLNIGAGCIGCHTASPDGTLLFMDWQVGSPATHHLEVRTIDGMGNIGMPSPGTVSANALANLSRQDQSVPVLSPAHFSANDAVVLTVLTDASTAQRSEIVWTDLHAASGGTGIVARMGDARQATTPSFSHDGNTIVYGSTDDEQIGVPGLGPGGISDSDVYVVPYNGGKGGPAAPIAGASTPQSEYYPVFAPGDAFVAFNRSTSGVKRTDPTAEVFVIPTAGGTAVRVAANDPPTCTGVKSPGITNSWPRWAPTSGASGGKRYYWLVFSSTRRSPTPQLFVSAVVTTAGPGNAETIDKTYPAIYVTSQVATEGNHTPAWTLIPIPPQK
jgi:hypothetical protein